MDTITLGKLKEWVDKYSELDDDIEIGINITSDPINLQWECKIEDISELELKTRGDYKYLYFKIEIE